MRYLIWCLGRRTGAMVLAVEEVDEAGYYQHMRECGYVGHRVWQEVMEVP